MSRTKRMEVEYSLSDFDTDELLEELKDRHEETNEYYSIREVFMWYYVRPNQPIPLVLRNLLSDYLNRDLYNPELK